MFSCLIVLEFIFLIPILIKYYIFDYIGNFILENFHMKKSNNVFDESLSLDNNDILEENSSFDLLVAVRFSQERYSPMLASPQ